MAIAEEDDEALMMLETEHATGLADRAAGISKRTLDKVTFNLLNFALERKALPRTSDRHFRLFRNFSQQSVNRLQTAVDQASDRDWILRLIQQIGRGMKN